MPPARSVGAQAEDRAAEFLAGQGYTLITRRFKATSGEIDLVALDGEVLAFVEVRRRTHPDYAPEASIDARKKTRIFAAAEAYLAKYADVEREVRFDLVAITPRAITLHKDAFRP